MCGKLCNTTIEDCSFSGTDESCVEGLLKNAAAETWERLITDAHFGFESMGETDFALRR